MIENNRYKNNAIVGSVIAAIAAISLIAADYTYGIRDRMQPMTNKEAIIARELTLAAENATGEFTDIRVDCGFDTFERLILGRGDRGYVVTLPGLSSNIINFSEEACDGYLENDVLILPMASEGMGAAGFGIVPNTACSNVFVNGYVGYLVEQRLPEKGFIAIEPRDAEGCDKTFKELTS
jgi:hypothetical protein